MAAKAAEVQPPERIIGSLQIAKNPLKSNNFSGFFQIFQCAGAGCDMLKEERPVGLIPTTPVFSGGCR